MMVPPGKTWKELAADLARELSAAQARVAELEKKGEELRTRWLDAERVKFEVALSAVRYTRFSLTRKTCECGEGPCGYDYADNETQRQWRLWQTAVGLVK